MYITGPTVETPQSYLKTPTEYIPSPYDGVQHPSYLRRSDPNISESDIAGLLENGTSGTFFGLAFEIRLNQILDEIYDVNLFQEREAVINILHQRISCFDDNEKKTLQKDIERFNITYCDPHTYQRLSNQIIDRYNSVRRARERLIPDQNSRFQSINRYAGDVIVGLSNTTAAEQIVHTPSNPVSYVVNVVLEKIGMHQDHISRGPKVLGDNSEHRAPLIQDKPESVIRRENGKWIARTSVANDSEKVRVSKNDYHDVDTLLYSESTDLTSAVIEDRTNYERARRNKYDRATYRFDGILIKVREFLRPQQLPLHEQPHDFLGMAIYYLRRELAYDIFTFFFPNTETIGLTLEERSAVLRKEWKQLKKFKLRNIEGHRDTLSSDIDVIGKSRKEVFVSRSYKSEKEKEYDEDGVWVNSDEFRDPTPIVNNSISESIQGYSGLNVAGEYGILGEREVGQQLRVYGSIGRQIPDPNSPEGIRWNSTSNTQHDHIERQIHTNIENTSPTPVIVSAIHEKLAPESYIGKYDALIIPNANNELLKKGIYQIILIPNNIKDDQVLIQNFLRDNNLETGYAISLEGLYKLNPGRISVGGSTFYNLNELEDWLKTQNNSETLLGISINLDQSVDIVNAEILGDAKLGKVQGDHKDLDHRILRVKKFEYIQFVPSDEEVSFHPVEFVVKDSQEEFESLNLELLQRTMQRFFGKDIDIKRANSVLRSIRDKVTRHVFKRIEKYDLAILPSDVDRIIHSEMMIRIEKLNQNLAACERDFASYERALRGQLKSGLRRNHHFEIAAKELTQRNIVLGLIHRMRQNQPTDKEIIEVILLGDKKDTSDRELPHGDYRQAVDSVILGLRALYHPKLEEEYKPFRENQDNGDNIIELPTRQRSRTVALLTAAIVNISRFAGMFTL